MVHILLFPVRTIEVSWSVFPRESDRRVHPVRKWAHEELTSVPAHAVRRAFSVFPWREGRGAFRKQCCHCVPVESPLIFLFWNYTSWNHYKRVFHLCPPCCNGKHNIFHWASLSSRALEAVAWQRLLITNAWLSALKPPILPPLKEKLGHVHISTLCKALQTSSGSAGVYFTIGCGVTPPVWKFSVVKPLAKFIPSCQSDIREMLSRYSALVYSVAFPVIVHSDYAMSFPVNELLLKSHKCLCTLSSRTGNVVFSGETAYLSCHCHLSIIWLLDLGCLIASWQ